MDGLIRYRDVRYWHLADIPSCTAHVCFSGVKRKLVRTCLVTCARIWREIFKLVRLAFPFFGICGRIALDRYIGPSFCIVSVELEPLFGPGLGVGLDRFHRTFRLTHPAIDAFLGMNDEHIFALVETIDGAHLDAIH